MRAVAAVAADLTRPAQAAVVAQAAVQVPAAHLARPAGTRPAPIAAAVVVAAAYPAQRAFRIQQ
jgi:hypothetical protein